MYITQSMQEIIINFLLRMTFVLKEAKDDDLQVQQQVVSRPPTAGPLRI